MKTCKINRTDLEISRIACGCMNMGGQWDHSAVSEHTIHNAESLVLGAVDSGINFFDHADIYVYGKSETAFGHVLKKHSGLRDKIVLQSKCGIIFADPSIPYAAKRYDFGGEHIIKSVEGILNRLQTDRLDILLLHRPDILVEPEQVAKAFDLLQASGKVRYFGVSNHSGAQIDLLAKHVRQPLVVNQIELSLLKHRLLNDGIIGEPTSTLEYCRLHDIQIQAWAPLANGRIFNVSDSANHAFKISSLLAKMAAEKNVSQEAIALAWLLRHPAGIQPVVGTTRLERLKKSAQADSVSLSHDEWYTLFTAARGGDIP